MSMEWSALPQEEQATFWTVVAFIKGRQSEAAVVEWALNLGPLRRAERIAVTHVLHSEGLETLEKPWSTVWELIEESWSRDPVDENHLSHYEITRRLAAGDRSGALVKLISDLVAPRVAVGPLNDWFERTPGPPKVPGDVIRSSLTSSRLIESEDIGLSRVEDLRFLTALANALEAEIRYGMDAGRRMGWDGSSSRVWLLGFLRHVEFGVGNRKGKDADLFHRGIAPSVKLLYAVVEQIAAVKSSAAVPFVKVWGLFRTPIDVRLWAAAASSPSLVLVEDVERFLLSLDDRDFWDLHAYPEIATLRACRFGDLQVQAQETITGRLRNLPPADHWPHMEDSAQLEDARTYWVVRELRRIEVCGGTLPDAPRNWVRENIARFDDLTTMGADQGFLSGATRGGVVPSSPPDPKYDGIKGVERLRALELAWTSASDWGDDSALAWLSQSGKASAVLEDLQAAGDAGAEFPHVWRRFGRMHRPSEDQHADASEAKSVLTLLQALPDETLRNAIEGVTDWMRVWRGVIVAACDWASAWLRVWPVAVQSTNSHYGTEDLGNLSVLVGGSDDEDLDAYNTPAADMVGIFLHACPNAHTDAGGAFDSGTDLRQVRDAIETCGGQSLLIARHRLIEWLPYFLQADQPWAQQNLIGPLRSGKPGNLALWRAASRRRIGTKTLKIIGPDVAAQANNPELGMDARTNLVFSLVVESLAAFYEKRPSALPDADLQQVLRSADDEVRIQAAETIVQFVRDQGGVSGSSPAGTFESAARPFLEQVWPQERTLVTPGVSRALAELPARSGEAFAGAVAVVRRYLVPFDSYSMMDYGLYGDDVEWTPKLGTINDEAKALALLELLNLSVGVSESAVVPHGLPDALGQIGSVQPTLAKLPKFRRLAAVARR